MFKWFKNKFENDEDKKDDIVEEIIDSENNQSDEEELFEDNNEIENLNQDVELIDDIQAIEEESKFEDENIIENDIVIEEENIEDNKKLYIDEIDVQEENNSDDQIEIQEDIIEQQDEVEEENKGFGFFKKIFSGLEKTRNNFSDKINDVLGNYVKIDDEMYEEIEDILITSDVGVDTTLKLIDNLREAIRRERITDPKLVMGVLAQEAKKLIDTNSENTFTTDKSPTIVLVVGVNGVGKTTTIGKLASKYKKEGKKVLLVAADTFRAAATEQLQEWASRSGVDIIHQAEGSDPAAVVFDSIQAAKARKADVILCDTAGRLHNKANLMNELDKIYRIIDKNYPEANKESLIVLDATTGQNALNQAKQFKEVAKVSGIVITKLDGTAKGGIILPLINELKVPVVYIGVGEKIDDLQPFDSDTFIDSIFSTNN